MRPARLASIAAALSLLAAAGPPPTKEVDRTMDTVFRKAVESDGRDYLDAEAQLVAGGAPAAATLRQNLNYPDPVARAMAAALLERAEGRAPEAEQALAYLDSLPERIAKTPINKPSPTGTASYLTLHFGDRAADMLAVRLVKETGSPHWRVMAILFYLKDQHRPSTTAPLIRFAAETGNDEWREAAVEAARAANDPDIAAKLAEERGRLHGQGKDLPREVEALGTP